MAEQIISIARIRRAAIEAAKRSGTIECPPEFAHYPQVWAEEYNTALRALGLGGACESVELEVALKMEVFL